MKKYDWEKFILITLSALIGAALLVALLRMFGFAGAIGSDFFEPTRMLCWIAFICGMVGLLGYFYYRALLKKDGYSNEEGSFYEQKENRIRIVKTFSIVSYIIVFILFGLFLSNDWPDHSNNWIFNGIFFLNLFLGCLGEAANNSLIAKVRPELQEDLTGYGLNKTYFKNLDEREKEKAGSASFKTMNLMGFSYGLVLLICCVAVGAFDVSPMICLPVGALWFLQTVTMLYYSCKEH
jgi:hypothetical protein